MPGQVLRRRMDDDVGARLEGALPERRGEGVVDRHESARSVGGFTNRRDVGDLEHRVGGRFDPHEPRGLAVRGDCGDDGVGVRDVDLADLAAFARGTVAGHDERGVVGVPGHDDGSPRSIQMHGVRHCRHARGMEECGQGSALELGDQLLGRVPRLVGPSRVKHGSVGRTNRVVS